jgi:hypothetical protein
MRQEVTEAARGSSRQTVCGGGRGEAVESRDVGPRGASHRLRSYNGAKQDKASRNAIARCQADSKSVAPGHVSNPEHPPSTQEQAPPQFA